MKKIFMLSLILFMLCGCGENSDSDNFYDHVYIKVNDNWEYKEIKGFAASMDTNNVVILIYFPDGKIIKTSFDNVILVKEGV